MSIADELRAALDDPDRLVWGEGPWEHLGDAERDVRKLLAEVAEQAERIRELEEQLVASIIDTSKAEAELAEAREALRRIADLRLDVTRDTADAIAKARYEMREIALDFLAHTDGGTSSGSATLHLPNAADALPEPLPRTCIFCPAILEEGRLRCSSCGKLQGDPFLPDGGSG